MTSFFPFSSSTTSFSSTSTLVNDDPHLQITVTPAASAFYAGESFSVTITFKNTRHAPVVPPTPSTAPVSGEVKSATRAVPSAVDRHGGPVRLPVRANRMGRASTTEETENGDNQAGPSRTPNMLNLVPRDDHALPKGYPYSPGANPASRAPGWPSKEDGAMIRSPEAWRRREYGDIGKGGLGHGRRTRSLAIGKGAFSPQEMVWALEGHGPASPPPLPSRRPQGASIPDHHPHSRKESITSAILSPPPTSTPLPTSDLASIPERPGLVSASSSSRSHSRPSSRTTNSATSSRSRLDLADSESRTSSEVTASRPRRPGASPSSSHSRTPSYHNAYGASLMGVLTQPPPPSHPYTRSQEPRGTTTILWAYTRLVAHFHPSNAHIPPDPLLPLRSMLLHQPVGSGSLMSASEMSESGAGMKPSSSRWQLSFGTGTIGNATQPSLTGSLFGLAKGLVVGGSGGTLEEERKRVWNMKDLPVLETTRSLLGVDVRLKEGEERSFTYTLPIPTNLPPAYRGKAFRFSYDLMVSVNVALPGKGNRQRTKEVQVPIRIWANVSLSQPHRTYDVLKPIIQTRDEGLVDEQAPDLSAKKSSATMERTRSKPGDSQRSLEEYARHLLGTLDNGSPARTGKHRLSPLSPSRVQPRARILSPSSPVLDLPDVGTNGSTLSVPGTVRRGRSRQGSFVDGDDELVEENGEGGCGEAVEILSRHSAKTSFDIAKDGNLVAVFTLVKSTFRLGESVLGVVTFNQPDTERRVLRFCAFLESHEIIPENLLPPSTGVQRQPPHLDRLHAEHASAYALHTGRLAFSLDIPSDATPTFALAAGPEGYPGGLEWRVRLSFLIASPRKHSRGAGAARGGHSLVGVQASHADQDNSLYAATASLAPVHRNPDAREGDEAVVVSKTEVIDCEIPIKVLAGNTAFLVKPSVHVV